MFGNEDKVAEKRMKQVVQAIENQDRNALKAMFSKQALDEADDFEESMDYLFELFQGQGKMKIINFDLGVVSESIEYGKRAKEVKSACDVITDDQGYVFFLIDYPVNTLEPDNVGLYTLRITDSEEDLSWQERKLPGIYKPDE